jgi:hypothetical protein
MNDAIYVVGFMVLAVVLGYGVYRFRDSKGKTYESLF